MMKEFKDVDAVDDTEYGVVLKFRDIEAADQFDDFLSESCFVLFQTKFEKDEVSFYFGQASSVDKVKELYGRFILSVSGD